MKTIGPSLGTPSARLRGILDDGRSHLMVSAYDCLTARISEAAGLEVLHVSGYCASAARAGVPDVGLLSMTELVDVCARICEAVEQPVIADADTGFGGPTNVRRTVRMFESAGAAGIHIEDQSDPKRCGHMSGKALIPTRDMQVKIVAALDARRDDDFVIIARTDAIAVEGIDAALERAAGYCAAGADMVLVDAPESVEQIERIAAEVPAPLVFDWAHGGVTPPVSRTYLDGLGYKLIVFPDIVHVVHQALARFHASMIAADTLDDVAAHFTSFDDFNAFVGLPAWEEAERSAIRVVDERGAP